MIIALAPLAFSAGFGYLLLNRGVIAPFQDVAVRQRDQIVPAQRLGLLVWDTLIPVDEYIEDGNAVHPAAYRSLRTRIEAGFASLIEALGSDVAVQTLVQRARGNWTAADRNATELISVPRPPGDPRVIETVERFHGQVVATNDKLVAAYDQLSRSIESDHDAALLSYERSIWLSGIAGAVSLMAVACGVILIGRIMAVSVDRLVNGAIRFAEGDRNHRIEVRVPPELHRVAEEFNHMIARIHESEAALSDLAHRDPLTGLSNRLDFDEAFPEMLARIQRFGEPGALLAIDIDHFKRINDTHGHAAGDEVLRAIAEVMEQNLRPFDRVFRVGGEEFAVLLPKTNAREAREAAERLRKAIAAITIRFRDVEISTTVSIGVAQASDGTEQSAVMDAADASLYRAKVGGRNRIVVSGEREIQGQDAA